MNTFNLKVLFLLSLGHCVVDIYNGALFGALPFLKDKLDLSYTMAGMILIASNIASSVIQPFFGFISDKKEKPILLPLGCLCAGVGFSLLVCYSTIRNVINRLADKIHLKISPHDFRRHSATYASRNGVPLEIVSKVLLRHHDLKTTQVYLGKINDSEAIRWMDVLHAKIASKADNQVV